MLRTALFVFLIAALGLSACAGAGLLQLGSSGDDFVGFSFHSNEGEPFIDTGLISTRTLFGVGVAIVGGSLILLTIVLVTFRVRK